MLRLGNSIRFTERELVELQTYTRINPRSIRTIADLEKYFAAAKQRYAGSSVAAELYAEFDEKMASLMQVGAHAA